MNYETFKTKVQNQFISYLPDSLCECSIDVRSYNKINRELEGMTISWPDKNVKGIISPILYLNDLYHKYEENGDFDGVLREAADSFTSSIIGSATEHISVETLRSTDKIIAVMINTQKNKALLQSVPHREILDLSVIYKNYFEARSGVLASVIVTNKMMTDIGFDEQELFECAFSNTKRAFYPKINKMSNIISQIFVGNASKNDPDNSIFSLTEELLPIKLEDIPELYVLTNAACIHGASALLFDEVLSDTAQMLKSDFYILPSSIHELMIITAEGTDPDDLCSIVKEANKIPACVSPNDVLSDNIYYYSRHDNKMKVIYNKNIQ